VAAESGRHYGPRELVLAEDLAVRAGLAVDNARLFRDAQQQASTHVALNAALRTAMAQLRQELQTRDDFLAAAAHDLNNPLASIKGTAQLLQLRRARPGGLDEQQLRAGLERIDAIATRATGQVDELLDLARMQMGRPLDLNRQPIDLVALAREAVVEHQQRSERHQLSLESSVSELIGRWDARRLARVLGNLLDNALKYSPNGGAIRVAVSRDDGPPGVGVLTVQDQGVGIPEEDLGRIFERFQRGTNVVGEIAGTGVGLASARHIVESHGGTITAASRQRRGATFTMRLPLETAGGVHTWERRA
jgi:signal transduction histidine kinase